MKQYLPVEMRHYVLIGIVWLLSACANTSIVSRSGRHGTTVKIQDVRVVWVENAKLQIFVIKDSRMAITDQDQAYARYAMSGMIDLFRRSAPTLIQTQLLAAGVSRGNASIVELSPLEAGIRIGGGRGCEIRVSIKDGTTSALRWSFVVKANGAPWDKDPAILDEFVKTVESELKEAGWI